MSVERVTVIIIIVHIYEHVTCTTVNIEYRKSDPSAAYPNEIAMMMMMSCRCPRDEAAVL
jgi:hypothetical protein